MNEHFLCLFMHKTIDEQEQGGDWGTYPTLKAAMLILAHLWHSVSLSQQINLYLYTTVDSG